MTRLLIVLLSSSAEVGVPDLNLQWIGFWVFELETSEDSILEVNPFLAWIEGLFFDLDTEVYEVGVELLSTFLLVCLVNTGNNLSGYWFFSSWFK